MVLAHPLKSPMLPVCSPKERVPSSGKLPKSLVMYPGNIEDMQLQLPSLSKAVVLAQVLEFTNVSNICE